MKKKYDFSKGVRGKYAKRFSLGTNLVAIDPDILKAFPNSNSVNEALRSLLKIAKRATEKVASL
jgi:hypothetical protein